MKRPMTTAELFGKIHALLEEKEKLPDILDYSLAEHYPEKITTYEFDLRNDLRYGGNEGIYLFLWLEWKSDGRKVTAGLGTYKTLRRDAEAMHQMADLLADFIIVEFSYVNNNLDDFTWEGADVYPYTLSGERTGYGYSCSTMEAALKKKDELLERCLKVVIRDNATRKEKVYTRKEKS